MGQGQASFDLSQSQWDRFGTSRTSPTGTSTACPNLLVPQEQVVLVPVASPSGTGLVQDSTQTTGSDVFEESVVDATARSVEDETRNDRRNANRNPEWWGDFSQLQKSNQNLNLYWEIQRNSNSIKISI